MSYLNSVTIVGFVGADPEQHQARGAFCIFWDYNGHGHVCTKCQQAGNLPSRERAAELREGRRIFAGRPYYSFASFL